MEEQIIQKVAEHDVRIGTLDVSELKAGQTELKEDFRQSQQDLKDRIKEVEDAPAKKTASLWDSIKEKIIWLVVGGIVTFILVQLLPNIFSK